MREGAKVSILGQITLCREAANRIKKICGYAEDQAAVLKSLESRQTNLSPYKKKEMLAICKRRAKAAFNQCLLIRNNMNALGMLLENWREAEEQITEELPSSEDWITEKARRLQKEREPHVPPTATGMTRKEREDFAIMSRTQLWFGLKQMLEQDNHENAVKYCREIARRDIEVE